MLCNNTRNYITEEIIRNQFCNVSKYYIIGELVRNNKLCSVIVLAAMVISLFPREKGPNSEEKGVYTNPS